MEPIVLASASPRRREYLELLGLPFTCVPSPIDESFDARKEGRFVAEELAVRKVKKVLEILSEEAPLWICGADTLISLDGRIYGKPSDREDAKAMLRAFQGKTHEVITAAALYNGRAKAVDCRSAAAGVAFAPLRPGK